MVFLSTSRVYPIASLRELPLVATETRFVIPEAKAGPGWSARGIAENFPLTGSRSLYGATKLCSELIITEYVALYGLPAVINRCGVVTGPWQMGKVDQGFIVFWAAHHLFGAPLSYNGFGGAGLQVRDALHVDDLYRLIRDQVVQMPAHSGKTYNVGGGAECSVSLAELTEACVERLSGYPFLTRDRELLKTLIVLRARVLPTCRNCPYLEHRVDQAPLLCPSAETVGINPEVCDPDHDAEN